MESVIARVLKDPKQSYPSAYDYEIVTLTSFARNDRGRSVKRDYAKVSE